METALSIASIAISVSSICCALLTFLWTARRDRKQATLEAYNRLQTEVFDPLNTYRPKTIQEICRDKTSAQYKLLSGYLARIQHFCVGLTHGIYDEKTFYALAHGYFDSYQLKRRILPILESKNGNSDSRELFYKDTLKVLDRMEKKGKKA